jgi:mannitol operon repressor
MAELIPMAKKKSPRKANLDEKEHETFFNELKKESDRGMVLITAALLDDMLGRCIGSFLIDNPRVDQLLDNFNGPLGSLGARALAAFSLGLLSESEYKDCDLMRRVRNSFAHNCELRF